MKKATLMAALAAVLISGIVIGAVGHLLYMNYRLARLNRMGSPGMRVRSLERLSSRLQLNETQRKAIDAILSRAHDEAAKLYEKQRPDTERLIQSTIADIRKLLDPEQVKVFQSMCEEFARHRPDFHDPDRPGRHVASDLKSALTLSPDQETKLHDILRRHMEKELDRPDMDMPGIGTNHPPSRPMDPRLLKELGPELEPILTAEQLERFRSMQAGPQDAPPPPPRGGPPSEP